MFAHMSRRPAAAALPILALAGLLAGCASSGPVSVQVYEQGQISSYVRSHKNRGAVEARGYSHPAVIASVRLAHALSFVDVESGEGKGRQRLPAVHPAIVYQVADALEAALAEADPNQQAVVMAVRREKRLGIFHADFLTSLIAWVKGDLLTLHFGHVDWEVPKIEGGRRNELPMPREDRSAMKLRIVPGPAVTLLGPQTVALDWKSKRFDRPSRIQLSPDGKVRRRTVLLEDEAAPEADSPPEGAVPIHELEPSTLRDLADLEDARRRGEVTEAEYQVRRREILEADPATR